MEGDVKRTSRTRRGAVLTVALLIVVAMLSPLAMPSASAAAGDTGAVITNGTVSLGVFDAGNLNFGGVGLLFNATGNDSTYPGCTCEGWGVGDATSGNSGFANDAEAYQNVTIENFTSTASTATSVVIVDDGSANNLFRVTHAYTPSVETPNLYQVDVSIENISGAPVDLRYRRYMDWDIEPTAFNEFVTIGGTAGASDVQSANVTFAGDTADPLVAAGGTSGDVVDSGPADLAASFTFDFGALAAGATKTFTTFYGGAATQTAANNALALVGAEVYSYGQTSTDPTGGTPNTFIFAFEGVGGAPVFPEVCDNGIDDDGDGDIDGADSDCAIAPPGGESVAGTKFYDVNTNGVQDAGEAGIEDWLIDVSNGSLTTVATDADGDYEVPVDPGTYDVAEQQAAGWIQTGPPDPGFYDDVAVASGQNVTGLDFGNVCVGDGGAHTKGFWQNNNGRNLFITDTAGALALLQGLNLRNEDGSNFDPTTYAQFRDWLRKARSLNQAYMLSAQLAAMALNVYFGEVDGTQFVYAPDVDGANAAGFITVNDLMADADAALAADGITRAGDPNRAEQGDLSAALDAANNNTTFVQASPDDCPTPTFAAVSSTLYADGSVACTGADDTSQPTGDVTFTPTQDQVSFAIAVNGLEPGIAYDVVISEEDDCDPEHFNPAGAEFTVDGSGNGAFSGSFAAADGTYNLLVKLVATSAPSDPKEAEIATTDTNVVVL
jgi:hypothetical protein